MESCIHVQFELLTLVTLMELEKDILHFLTADKSAEAKGPGRTNANLSSWLVLVQKAKSQPNLPLCKVGNPLFINKITLGKWDLGALSCGISFRQIEAMSPSA